MRAEEMTSQPLVGRRYSIGEPLAKRIVFVARGDPQENVAGFVSSRADSYLMLRTHAVHQLLDRDPRWRPRIQQLSGLLAGHPERVVGKEVGNPQFVANLPCQQVQRTVFKVDIDRRPETRQNMHNRLRAPPPDRKQVVGFSSLHNAQNEIPFAVRFRTKS